VVDLQSAYTDIFIVCRVAGREKEVRRVGLVGAGLEEEGIC